MSLKEIACVEIDKNAGDLLNISQEIWKHPELKYEEKYAHDILTNFLEKNGFRVSRKYKLDTAFRAEYGTDEGPNVVVICEYDALAEIGHACGHNLIAEAGVAAAIGIKSALVSEDNVRGKVTVLGTPAEEGGGGKIDLIEERAFDDVDVAMMVHPAPSNHAFMSTLARVRTTHTTVFDELVVEHWLEKKIAQNADGCTVEFFGKAAHAAGFPWEGVNALDAAVLAYQNVSCLRQQLKPTWRVHGVFRKGGVAPNIIPDNTELEFSIRAPTNKQLDELKAKVHPCFLGAAQATGCEVQVTYHPKVYSSLLTNSTMSQLYVKYCKQQGMTFPGIGASTLIGSTDMGNVSHVVPSIHPIYDINTQSVNHNREFTESAGSLDAQANTLKVAKALAMIALDIYSDPNMLQQIKEDFKKDLADDS